jgi:hypothetical protein
MAGSLVATTTSRKGRGIVRVDVTVTCASGAMSATSIGSFFGRLIGVMFAVDGTPVTSTADVLLTDAKTGAPILSDLSWGAAASAYRPTQGVADTAGATITAATTASDVNRDIYVAGKLNLAIANATTTDTGTVSFLFDEGV